MTPMPARSAPGRTALPGRYASLVPIAAEHAADLYAATGGEGEAERYQWLFETPAGSEDGMRNWIGRASALDDPLMLAVIDNATGKAGGRQAFMRIAPEHGCLELGAILWGRSISRTRMATEAVYLVARHTFEDLGFRRLEWKCNDFNAPSKRSAKRFGFTYEGLFRQHMIVKGANRDTAWFSMIDADWPAIKAEYDRWLAPDNFDADGQQKTRLNLG